MAYRSVLNWFVRIATLGVMALGIAVIAGWIFDIVHLKSVVPGLASMKANTAAGLVAAAASLWILHVCAPESPWLHVARFASILVSTLGGLSLSEDVFAVDLGIDQLIILETSVGDGALHPGRMAPSTAFCFFLLGIATLLLKIRSSRLARRAHWLVVPPLLVSTLAIAGYLYGVKSLYAVWSFGSMALHTAAAFLLLSLSALATDSEHGFARIATSDTVGGLVTRWSLPTIPFVIFAIGWARLQGEQAGYYDSAFGLALMAIMCAAFCVLLVAWIATRLHGIDVARMHGEMEILALNAALEHRVQERTLQLARLSADLTAANETLQHLSLQDELTDLANRRCFDQYLAAQVDVAHRHKRALALVLFDVDAFKAYNDQYGHQSGDECLKHVAAALKSCCHRPADMAARYGGEEFALLLPDTTLAGAAIVAERVRDAVARLNIPHSGSQSAAHVSISAGVSVLHGSGNFSAEQLFALADKALYQAKNSGRNRVAAIVEVA